MLTRLPHVYHALMFVFLLRIEGALGKGHQDCILRCDCDHSSRWQLHGGDPGAQEQIDVDHHQLLHRQPCGQ